MRIRPLVLHVVTAMAVLSACAGGSASQLTFADSSIETYAERSGGEQPATGAAQVAPSGTPTVETPTPLPAPTPKPTPTSMATPASTSEPSTEPPVEPTAAIANEPKPISAAGSALGCRDATPLRQSLREAPAAVSEAASIMIAEIWLCPITLEVHQAMVCYEEETFAILDALEAEYGDSAADIVSQIRETNTMFCADGDVIYLGIPDILDRLEDEAEHG